MGRGTKDERNAEQWHVVKGIAITGILCEVSHDRRRLRFRRKNHVEVVDVEGLAVVESVEVLTETKADIQ